MSDKNSSLTVPTFAIASNTTIKLSNIKARRFYIVDRSQILKKQESPQSIMDSLVNSDIM